ncbi:ABC transporter substrate-binding protein [Candidatus Poriferisocius sp.]|uniref:ABC transporter substrate-binding protein n=1 Tax=Candidatus Poriferisocius sp. TaxID=3101276 RepID=UPI003B013DCD
MSQRARQLGALALVWVLVAACAGSESGGVSVGPGVDAGSKTIRVGVNTDLSGIFTTHSLRAAEGHVAYWEWLNDRGGIRGWQIEPVVMDNGYDVAAHVENYEVMSGDGPNSVVMFSVSTGSPQNEAIVDRLAEDEMAAVPFSRHSRWADAEMGSNLFETLVNYCVEAMNGATHMAEAHGDKVALVSFDNEYGRDSAEGLRIAAEAKGLEIVYDAGGAISSGDNLDGVISRIAASGADWVWLGTSPETTVALLVGAEKAGFEGQWSGSAPSWSPLLLLTQARWVADTSYTHVAAAQLWNVGDSQGMQEMVWALRQYRPRAAFDDLYVYSWIQGYVTTQILDRAIADGDLTRAGVLAAAGKITADLKGLGPDQSWSGEPDDIIARGSYIYDVDLSLYAHSLLPEEMYDFDLGVDGIDVEFDEWGHTVGSDHANAGYRLIKGPYVSDVARDWNYRPCS